MADPLDEAPMVPYQHILSRVLVLSSPPWTSPWQAGMGPTRPLWAFQRFRQTMRDRRNPLYRAIADGTIPLDRSPVLDLRPLLSLGLVRADPYWYSHLRGIYARFLPHGVRLTAMVRWGAPSARRREWARYWHPPSMGALWVMPALHPHSRWGISVEHWVETYRAWFDPILGYDSGVVLDTRMLALAGVPLPLPAPMVDLLRPIVRCLSLADIPHAGHETAFGWPSTARPWLGEAPWVPGTAGRYSLKRWQAFVAQFPDVPVLVPAATSPTMVPAWVRAVARAQPPVLPDGVVWPPPDHRSVSLRFPQPLSRAQIRAQRIAQRRRAG